MTVTCVLTFDELRLFPTKGLLAAGEAASLYGEID